MTKQLIADEHAAEDLAQDTALAALGADAPRQASVRTWLSGIARNLAAFRYRGESRRIRHESAAGRQAAEDRPTTPSAADVCVKFSLHRSVVEAVMELDERTRAIVLMRFWEDLSAREIAAHFELPVETVRTRIKRGIASMRRRLDAEHGDRRAWAAPLLGMSLPAPGLAMAAVTSSPIWFGVIAMNIQAKVAIATTILTLAILSGSGMLSSTTVLPDEPAKSAIPPVTAGSEPTEAAVQSPAKALERTAVDDASNAAPDAEVRGRVVDESGRGIAGVEVCQIDDSYLVGLTHSAHETASPEEAALLRMHDVLSRSSMNGGLEGRTIFQGWVDGELIKSDQSGHFSFRDRQDGTTYLGAWHPEHGVRVVRLPPKNTPITIEFQRWPRITGVVTTTDDVPLAGATVDVRLLRLPNHSIRFKTDEKGAFRSVPVPPDTYYLPVSHEGYESQTKRLGLVRETRIESIQLKNLDRLDAQLVDDQNHPWTAGRFEELGWDHKRIRVSLGSRSNYASALDLSAEHPVTLKYDAAHGTIAGFVEWPERNRFLTLLHGKEFIGWAEVRDLTQTRIRIAITRPQPDAKLEVGIDFATRLSPTPEIEVQLFRHIGPRVSFNNKSEVSVRGQKRELTLIVPGSLRSRRCFLVLTAAGFAETVVEIDVPTTGAVSATRVTLHRADSQLLGRVVDPSDKSIPGAKLTLGTIAGGYLVAGRNEQITGADGRFSFSNLASGELRLFVVKKGYAVHSQAVSPDASGGLVVRLSPAPPRKIRFATHGVQLRVLDAVGAPLFDDRIQAGNFRYGGATLSLPANAYRIEAYQLGAQAPCLTGLCSTAIGVEVIELGAMDK